MKRYLVTWEIEIDADCAAEAVAQALIAQRDEGSTALVFDVVDSESGKRSTIDLWDKEICA